ncbi:methyltransferase [Aureococcus anophagefferens]|nr:methyltransferase [Aureococcus anophagefferens]
MYETQNGCAATVEFAAAAGFHVPFETRAFLCDHAADHAAASSPHREINVFFASDATRARPICPHVLDYCIEREDVLTVGFHAQLPTCRGDERCETDVCREGEGHCLIYLDARNCWCTT